MIIFMGLFRPSIDGGIWVCCGYNGTSTIYVYNWDSTCNGIEIIYMMIELYSKQLRC